MFLSCSTTTYDKTVAYVDIDRFMGDWFVLAARGTFLEDGQHNSIETYTWNEKEKRIDVKFVFNKYSFDGEKKVLRQKAWIENSQTNAHWKIQLFWPLKFDYLVIALDPNYEWVAIGVPDEKYLWIMSRKYSKAHSSKIVANAIRELDSLGYSTRELILIPHH
ncbi:lipocalin family protein [Bacteriovorax sp. BAL6_X]|uniref:lipocalin family protein n=1 Tax=Bacteriovorax sp. BAL6_X TaxID=1201290 RepID=UPI0012EE7953|nr:lipocalin family protein [Bacteriovorax sp. BAL6_X]